MPLGRVEALGGSMQVVSLGPRRGWGSKLPLWLGPPRGVGVGGVAHPLTSQGRKTDEVGASQAVSYTKTSWL